MELLKYPTPPGITAFSTKRHGGVGEGAYSSFNITHYCGDSHENVTANRALLCTHLGIDDTQLILPHQTHGTDIIEIDKKFLALDTPTRAGRLYSVDALFTREKGICIGVSTADCIPVLLCDETSGTIAAIHAGWRGTVARIVEKSILAMRRTCNINPATTRAIIAPGISLDAFEVGDEVYDAFRAASFPMEKIARRYGERWHIDLPRANSLQLLSCGLSEANIHHSGICTYFSHADFFSARRLGIKSGRVFNGIIIK
ncbi:MAG: peptidoglycan editing factor PgeF [Bacteroidaceae bacterium]|nr:peptidoglycan editing factor PgeF [Bacteroidaceae bacterium]